MAGNVREIVEDLVSPILNELALELVDVEFKKEGKSWFLRVFIDSENGVDLDDCTVVSERLSDVLDKEDPIEQAYYLEVSSPGAERPLKKETDYARAVGKHVHLTTYAPIDGEKIMEGKLLDYDGEALTIEISIKTRKKQLKVPMDKIAKARLAVTF
ncbi:ribosome maturation factor RimP [Evansella caseinilytica]|uniref:Ribosome maturation factor RimP n=1 Tax=Evansella caseinilytica TaxID=1503961 RepID=A0A1H3M312_9BACI|nr:ribosome maturation factor RimP [Evansella caseinilytica]SDY70658.1 ribosome maturation factor RimP [Evansella caseinilytica]